MDRNITVYKILIFGRKRLFLYFGKNFISEHYKNDHFLKPLLDSSTQLFLFKLTNILQFFLLFIFIIFNFLHSSARVKYTILNLEISANTVKNLLGFFTDIKELQ